MLRFLKVIFALFGLLVLIIGIGLFTANMWLPTALATVINQVTGLPVQIERSQLNLGESQFGVYGIKIQNPKGFPDGTFVSIPEIYVDFDSSKFFEKKEIYFDEVRLDIDDIWIVKNASGVMNVTQLKTVKKDKSEAAEAKPAKKEKIPFFIEKLVLTIRNVRYKDESLPVPVDRAVDLKINKEVIPAVSKPSDIVRLIMMKVLYSTTFASLGAPVDLLKNNLGPSLAKGQAIALESTQLAKQMGLDALGEGKRMVEDAAGKLPGTLPTEEVQQLTQNVKGKASSLFKGAENFLKTTTENLEEKVNN